MQESQLQQQQIIATSGAALQTFSSLFTNSQDLAQDTLDASHRSIRDHGTETSVRGPPRRYPTRRPVVTERSSSSCLESYSLFKKCSTARETEGFSCSDAVARYMRCALNDGC